ncbi:argonaute-like protein [Chitinophaga dinghuensis]|uniref:Protein argonaute n=1 Tax=Chitinophaga dinghuensis TaxID=1539050 RepID=A0A327VVU1_9BACT|nr:Piwi domain-containing protein [Chitinophaga dinghuensis]RAJ78954.1 argonaute-like protein [Chitinophaga dinghuensis]
MPQILNVAPILFDSAFINIEKIPYSDTSFESVQNTYRTSHLIKRKGDHIFLVPLFEDSPLHGGDIISVELKEDLSLASSLVRDAIYKHLLLQNVHLTRIVPITYLRPLNNILESCIPDTIKFIKGLGVYPKWEIDFRVISPNGKTPFVSMTLNVSVAPRITMSCQSLLSAGINLTGYYVGTSHTGKRPDLKPHFRIIGRVVRILDTGMLELDDVREGMSNQIDPVEVYIEPRQDILETCIRHFYNDQASIILDNLAAKTASFHVGDSKLKKLNIALEHLQKVDLKLANQIPFRIGNFLSDAIPDYPTIKVDTVEKPVFVFSNAGGKNSEYNDLGLQRYGPYTKESFSPTKPNICVIYQNSKKGQVETILHKFLNGIPPVEYGKGGKKFEFTGLKTKFYLQECILSFFGAGDDTVIEYNKAITSALQAGQNGPKWDMAIIQIDNCFRDRYGNDNPYLIAKSRFIGQGIPVQEFTMESLGLPDSRVVWSLNNMALATYAKLGGQPWLLAADKPIAHELVIGIGSSLSQNSRLGQKERMIGITTVFTGDGNYFINNVSAAVPADEYFDTLLANLRNTMTSIQKSFNWQPRDTVRLIFHAFKTFKEKEADVVKQVVSELGNYNVEFSFIHVAETHPYLLFDPQQSGFGYYKKGIHAPERGKYLQLSEHVSLVSLTGPQEVKQADDGLPSPVQLILHRDSTFKDLTYLSKQVLRFGAHSWRSFLPASMPVTIYYSQLMAQMLSQLNEVSSWNPDNLYNKISSTRWFL